MDQGRRAEDVKTLRLSELKGFSRGLERDLVQIEGRSWEGHHLDARSEKDGDHNRWSTISTTHPAAQPERARRLPLREVESRRRLREKEDKHSKHHGLGRPVEKNSMQCQEDVLHHDNVALHETLSAYIIERR